MAARQLPQFYVYGFEDDGGFVYIGKGCKKRLRAQQRKFARLEPLAKGRVLDWFLTERAALAAEKEYIEKHRPRLNKTAGGNGGRVKHRANRLDFWERRLLKVGKRKYAAQLLLACERAKPGTLDPSKVDAIRQVADGCRV
jgi:hypothetical protein